MGRELRDMAQGDPHADVCHRQSSHLELFEIRALFGHHCGQQLVLEPVPGDQEVDECTLCLHLGFVVGVEVLGMKDQAEIGVVLHFLVTNLDEPGR